MQLTEGSVVKSTAGHDAGSYGVVMGFMDGWPLVADGKHRLLGRPKRKNPKHLVVLRQTFVLSEIHSDKMLRRLLWPFQYGGQPEADGR